MKYTLSDDLKRLSLYVDNYNKEVTINPDIFKILEDKETGYKVHKFETFDTTLCIEEPSISVKLNDGTIFKATYLSQNEVIITEIKETDSGIKERTILRGKKEQAVNNKDEQEEQKEYIVLESVLSNNDVLSVIESLFILKEINFTALFMIDTIFSYVTWTLYPNKKQTELGTPYEYMYIHSDINTYEVINGENKVYLIDLKPEQDSMNNTNIGNNIVFKCDKIDRKIINLTYCGKEVLDETSMKYLRYTLGLDVD